jgi:hypothetical protein
MEAVMTNEEIRKYQMLGRVREFGAAHRDLFPARSVAGKLFAAVAAAADALQQHDSKELAGRGGEQDGAASKAAARAALRRQLGAIAHTARAAEAPGLGGKFRASLSCGDERLLSQARTFLKEAKPFAETFVAHELPSNFLRQLQAAIDAFERAMRERASGRDQRVGARARFDASMKAALHAVRRLNAIVPNRLDDPAAVALWNLARRVDNGRVRNAEVTTPDATTQPPTPAPADAANPAA